MSKGRLPKHARQAAGASTRLMQTSVFDAPPRARVAALPGTGCRAFARLHRMRCKPSVLTHGALSEAPSARRPCREHAWCCA